MPSCSIMSMSNTKWLMELLSAHFWRKQKTVFFSLLPSSPPSTKAVHQKVTLSAWPWQSKTFRLKHPPIKATLPLSSNSSIQL
jgi:hypothetical protein